MGVTKEILQEGSGTATPRKGQTVTIHYRGTLASGKPFDASYDRGEPFQCVIGVGEVIQGWDEAVTKMKLNEKAKLTITPDYGYGNEDVGDGLIPPNSTLIFEVHLLAFK